MGNWSLLPIIQNSKLLSKEKVVECGVQRTAHAAVGRRRIGEYTSDPAKFVEEQSSHPRTLLCSPPLYLKVHVTKKLKLFTRQLVK